MKDQKKRIKAVEEQAIELVRRLVDQDTDSVDALAITGTAFFKIAESLGFKEDSFMKMVAEMAKRLKK